MTGRAFHFISSLPRYGSMLLSAILRQNPDVHAHITSPVGSLLGAVLNETSASHKGSVLFTHAQRQALPRGLFDADHEVVRPHRLRSAPSRHRQTRPDARAHRGRGLCGSTSDKAEFAPPSAALEPAAA